VADFTEPSPSEVTIRLDHKPGEKVQVDFSDGVWLTDSTTGKKTLTEFFLGGFTV
jgi:hypothetical protein